MQTEDAGWVLLSHVVPGDRGILGACLKRLVGASTAAPGRWASAPVLLAALWRLACCELDECTRAGLFCSSGVFSCSDFGKWTGEQSSRRLYCSVWLAVVPVYLDGTRLAARSRARVQHERRPVRTNALEACALACLTRSAVISRWTSTGISATEEWS